MSQPKPSKCVFIGNISYEADEVTLKKLFEENGPVVSFRMVYDKKDPEKKLKGFAFCEYKDEFSALSAMRNLNGKEAFGRKLKVDFANDAKGGDKKGGSDDQDFQQLSSNQSSVMDNQQQIPSSSSSSSNLKSSKERGKKHDRDRDRKKQKKPNKYDNRKKDQQYDMDEDMDMRNDQQLSMNMQQQQQQQQQMNLNMSGFSIPQNIDYNMPVTAPSLLNYLKTSIPEAKMRDALTELKVLSMVNPDRIRQILLTNSQFAVAVLQMQYLLGFLPSPFTGQQQQQAPPMQQQQQQQPQQQQQQNLPMNLNPQQQNFNPGMLPQQQQQQYFNQGVDQQQQYMNMMNMNGMNMGNPNNMNMDAGNGMMNMNEDSMDEAPIGSMAEVVSKISPDQLKQLMEYTPEQLMSMEPDDRTSIMEFKYIRSQQQQIPNMMQPMDNLQNPQMQMPMQMQIPMQMQMPMPMQMQMNQNPNMMQINPNMIPQQQQQQLIPQGGDGNMKS